MKGLQYGKYTFTCKLDAPAILPEYKGSTFRGVFGTAFKHAVCALKHPTCDDCPLRRHCLYTVVFETPLAVSPKSDLRVSATPHPFVLQPPKTRKQNFAQGDAFQFTLLLFGEVNAQFRYFFHAFQEAGRTGIGKRINGRRPSFHIIDIHSGGQSIYVLETGLPTNENGVEWLTVTSGSTSEKTDRVHLTLKSPLRFKFKNRIERDLPFHLLVRAMLRRISSLFIAYADGEPNLDYKGLLERAEKVRTAKKHLFWHDWERYSNRQKQRMPMSGIAGDIVYEGELDEFMPFIDICSKLNIGKNTAFGLGKIGVDIK
ncbi:MAG: CRISPR system precrRNA processing endoribonuclease RAMP protein Cas6 [Desulfococcus multivorans]|jgi:CRISPR/Cas system endoribonuclease Cas6 (RAMP superfamily)|nr:CRISPR system precrRNA processing endoribonuclease RAMP protein Cas6 [Desulfococcus multivorans]